MHLAKPRPQSRESPATPPPAPPRTTPPGPTLPPELLLQILQHASLSSSSLSALCLVSKSFLDVTRDVLYRTITLTVEGIVAALRDGAYPQSIPYHLDLPSKKLAKSLLNQPYLATRVHALRLTKKVQGRTLMYPPASAILKLFLASFPNLTTIHLHGFYTVEMPELAKPLEGKAVPLTALHFHETLYITFPPIPTLREFTISGVDISMLGEHPPTFKLKKLTLCEGPKVSAEDTFTHILTNSFTTLTHLTLTRWNRIPDLELERFTSLTHLDITLTGYNTTTSLVPLAAAIGSCAVLTHLALAYPKQSKKNTVFSYHATSSFLDSFPNSVRELEMVRIPMSTASWVDRLQGGWLGHLRVLRWKPTVDEVKGSGALEEVCWERGVLFERLGRDE
ncbi:hypothetical protein MNV49_006541 [Pseudohyphozyma bogoriensis]|nr:hypothetical protein MNV49_006541 [Pseudohyphozyma bogoriensis]